MKPRSMILAVLLASGCGSPEEKANAILASKEIRSAMSQISASSSSELGYCKNIPSSVDAFTPMSGRMDPILSTVTCRCVASNEAALVGGNCAVDITLVGESDGEFKQINEGAISSGAGTVYLFTRNDATAVIVQENNAQGSGCTQKNYNAIVFEVPPLAGCDTGVGCSVNSAPFCALTYTVESTCGHVGTWKASAGTWREIIH